MMKFILELKRKAVHILSGIIIVALIYYNLINAEIVGAAIIFSVVASLAYKKYNLHRIDPALRHFERTENIRKFPGKGAIYYLVGVFIAMLLFEKDVAMASILIMAMGDSFAALVGFFGKIKCPYNKNKSVEGIIAGATVAFIAALVFINPLEAGIASVIAMIVESLDIKVLDIKVDDNITMPLVAGSTIWIIRTVFGY
jgi:dolichol kinase